MHTYVWKQHLLQYSQGHKQVTLLNAVVCIYSSAISNNCTTKLINDTTDARLHKK